MAIYHNSIKIISRSSGRSAVGASAYRSGEKMLNEYDGIEHDFSRKQGIVYSEIMLPQQAKEEFKNRATLWNEVEKIEKSKNSQLAREVEVALPKELSREQQIELIKDYVKNNFVKRGMCADINIHDKGDGNPHSHIMLTMRELDENGQFKPKSEKLYYCKDSNNNEKFLSAKELKLEVNSDFKKSKGKSDRKRDLTPEWNDREKFAEVYRESWANKINEKLKELGINQKVDHRSYEEQGIKKVPTIHEGATARKMERDGKVSDRMKINRRIRAINKQIKQCNIGVQKLKNETIELNKSFKSEDELVPIKNNMKELQEYKNKISDVTQRLKGIKREKEQLLTCDKENKADIENLKKSIVAENERKSSLGFFKRKEKSYCDDRIDKYSKQIETLEKSLLPKSKIAELTKEIAEVDKKLDIENKKMSEYNEKFNELFDKEYKLELDRKNKGREINTGVQGIKQPPTTERPKIDKDEEFMKEYLEKQRRRSLAQQRNLSHDRGR